MASDGKLIGSERGAVHFERRVLWLAIAVALPSAVLAFVLLWSGSLALVTRVSLTAAVFVAWVALAFALRAYVVHPLRTLSNLAAALREGDFSVRARGASTGDALGLALLEFNRLGSILSDQRLTALDASALARAVMREINVAVFVFDEDTVLRLINRAAERLIGQPSERAIGKTASALDLEECLVHDFSAGRPAASVGGARRSAARAARGGADGLAATTPRAWS